MELTRINNTDHPHWDSLWDLYLNSFPLCEQRPLAEHIKAMDDPDFHCNIITDGDLFVGLMMWWDWDDDGAHYRFGEHFAIDPLLRNGGYGSRALPMMLGDGSRLMMLEIDPPLDDISRRREQFYMRHDLHTNRAYHHVHPSFRPSTSPHELLVMSYPRLMTPDEFAQFRRYNLGHVLKYVEQ